MTLCKPRRRNFGLHYKSSLQEQCWVNTKLTAQVNRDYAGQCFVLKSHYKMLATWLPRLPQKQCAHAPWANQSRQGRCFLFTLS